MEVVSLVVTVLFLVHQIAGVLTADTCASATTMQPVIGVYIETNSSEHKRKLVKKFPWL